jgi:hypothetical protein
MATQSNPNQHEQQHPVVQQQSNSENHAAKQETADTKPEVLDPKSGEESSSASKSF